MHWTVRGAATKGIVCLGLVLLVTDLVPIVAGVSSVSLGRGLDSTGCDLHGLGLLIVGDLGGLAVSDNVLPLVGVGADISGQQCWSPRRW